MKLFFVSFCLFLFSFSVFGNSKHSIPFEFINNQIYIDFKFNEGTTYRFLYDTGANGITLDSSLKNTKGFEQKFLYNNPLNIKTSTFSKTIRFLSFKNINQSAGDLCNGIIGLDFFKDYIVEVDYTKQALNLFDLDYKIDNSYKKINAKLVRNNHFILGIYIIPIEIELLDTTIIKGKFAIDTGSSRNITLTNPLYHNDIKTSLKEGRKMNVDNPNPYYKFKDPIYFNISKLSIDTFTASNLLVDYTELNSKEAFDGIIGGAFLRNFNLLIDYSNTSIYIKEKKHSNGFLEDLVTDGFRMRDERKTNGKIIVSGIVKGIFSKKDLKIGDEILEINTITVSEIDFSEILAKKEVLGTKIKYKIKRNKRIFEVECLVKKIVL